MLRPAIFLALIFLIPIPAQAAWAVAQPPGNQQPFLQRFRLPDDARQQALDACNTTFSGCKTVITGNSGCVAIVKANLKFTVAKGGTTERATAAAMKTCEALNAGACRVDLTFCGR
jgi:hypothetical protein